MALLVKTERINGTEYFMYECQRCTKLTERMHKVHGNVKIYCPECKLIVDRNNEYNQKTRIIQGNVRDFLKWYGYKDAESERLAEMYVKDTREERV